MRRERSLPIARSRADERVIATEHHVRKGAFAMELAEFVAMHGPALEARVARNNLILGILDRAQTMAEPRLQLWSLGAPGACAIKTPLPGRGIILGELDRAQCEALARITADVDYPSVAGPDDSPKWFVEAAEALGIRFEPAPLAQRIHALSRPPSRPQAPGHARLAGPDDVDLVHEWALAFTAEAAPEDGIPPREHSEQMIADGRRFLWVVDGAPVSMAGLGRLIRDCASISPVYTPPELRARGYAGAVTSAVVDAIFAGGRRTACLYTDLANPYSNRCYAKLGFEPVCDAWVYVRAKE
jgi:RimJ/RimL family protein N-acetyltransferase